MKYHLIIKMMSLVCILLSHSVWAGGKAEIDIRAINNQQWPVQYQITLTPPVHYHAYLDSGTEDAYLPVAIDPKHKLAQYGIKIKQFKAPQGEFDADVKATVLRGQGLFQVEFVPIGEIGPSTRSMNVDLRYQLCDEVTNVCFRPQTVSLPINVPLVAYQEEDDRSWMEQLVGLFSDNQDNGWLLFALMFMAGILSVATPCVYPMLPITSMLIVNRAQGETGKIKFHASVYLLGMIGTYVALGIAAGMTGGAFNSFMQSAAVNLTFAAFFAFFAVSLLGYYEFAFMQGEVGNLDQKTSKVNGLMGTWMMGSVAGLVISPCVGPIVFALLLQVADNIAAKADALAALGQTLGTWDKLSISLKGGLMMGGFGLGVGLPFFIVSVIKFKLPRAGYWMNKVKYAFGFAILYFAYGYFAKGMGVLGVADEITQVLSWGLLILWVAIVHFNILESGAHDQHPTRKLAKFTGVITLILGGWLFISGLNQVPLLSNAQANTGNYQLTANKKSVHSEGGIIWLHSFDEAKKQAKQTGKPIFIDFYASWCANCLAFAKETVNNHELNKALRELAIPLKIIDKTPEFEAFKQSREHRQLKIGLPYFAILNSDGELQWSGVDYQATDKMISVLQKLN